MVRESSPGADRRPATIRPEVVRPHLERAALVARLLAQPSRALVLTGGSGIGKSDLLGALQQRDSAVAPAPHALESSAGALQRGLINQLGAAVADLIDDQSRLEKVSGHLADAARRLARTSAQDLAKVVGKELLAVLRGRVGEHVGDAVGDYIKELKGSYDERLEQRLASAADPSVVSTVTAFASEVVELANGRRVTLALDRVDGLGDTDIGLLIDVMPQLPEQVFLRLGFATDRGKHQELARLRSAGATEVIVPPFSAEDIAELLTPTGLDPARATEIERVSSGYPLHVGDAIVHLARGGALENLPLNEVFEARTQEAWNTLEAPIAVAARRLAVYPTAPGRERTAHLVGNIDLHGWGEVERRLVQSGVFTTSSGGQPWFHEQRRRVIWTSVLSAEERAESARLAFEEIQQELRSTGHLGLTADLALVAATSDAAGIADPDVTAVLNLSRDELALMAALVELAEPRAGSPAVPGDLLLEHARLAFHADGDLISALESLKTRGFVHVESNDHAAAVVRTGAAGAAGAVLAGRASLSLGRVPIPAAASEFFEVELRSRISPFRQSVYGVGRTSVAALADAVDQLRYERTESLVTVDRPRPALLVRGRYAEVDVYAAIEFELEGQRDDARLAISGNKVTEELVVTDLLDYPHIPVPSKRFLAAAERLTGKLLTHGSARLTLDQPLPLEEALRRQQLAEDVVRSRCSRAELLAYQLEEPSRWLYRTDPNGQSVLVELIGSSAPPEWRPDLEWRPFAPDPFERFRLARRLSLSAMERLGRMSAHGGPRADDPVVAQLEDLQRAAGAYNRRAKKFEVTASVDQLHRLLLEAQVREMEDAQALAAALPASRPDGVVPHDLDLIVFLDEPRPGWVPLADATVAYREGPSRSDAPAVNVRVEPATSDTPDPAHMRAVTEAEFGQGLHGHGDARHVLGRLLGYDPMELWLNYPDT